MISAAFLQKVCPTLSAAKAATLAAGLWPAMQSGNVVGKERECAFIAQTAHETCSYQFVEEIWGPTPAQRRYEGRADLGNTQAGDGYRFRGRGYIQITGRANYRKFGKAIGADLENNPDLASRPDVAARIAVAYWLSRGLNELADAGNFKEITRRINGGYNGLADRQRYYALALANFDSERRVFLYNGKGYVVWDRKPGGIYGGLPLTDDLFTQLALVYPAGTKTTYQNVKLEVAADGAFLLNKF